MVHEDGHGCQKKMVHPGEQLNKRINKYWEREPHHTSRPFDIVSNIPPKTHKTTLDIYNGYHQVRIDKDSIN